MVRLVEAGALQLAILRPPGKAGTLNIEVLRHEPIIAAMRTDNKLAKVSAVPLKALNTERVVRVARNDRNDPFVQIDRKLEAIGVELDQCTAADGALTALALVAAGDVIALVPSWIASLPWQDVLFKAVEDLGIGIELAAVWETAGVSPIVQHFIDVARRVAG